MIRVVPIDQVIPRRSRGYVSSVRKMREVLTRQGQIEPLQVEQVGENAFVTFGCDTWADAIIHAARELEWPTLLIGIVADGEKFEF